MAKTEVGANVAIFQAKEDVAPEPWWWDIGEETAEDWHAFAESAGWGDNPGGLMEVMLREYIRFWLRNT